MNDIDGPKIHIDLEDFSTNKKNPSKFFENYNVQK